MRIEDLGRVRFPESMEEALSKINPNGHDEVNDANFAWSGNCTHCVPAYELRKRGYDVSALPYTDDPNGLSYDPFDAWEDPIIHKTPGSGREAIERAMASYGDGARVEIDVGWATSDGSGFDGHVFVAEQRDGKTYFIDPQNGDADVSWYFDHVQPGATRFARIDNLTPSDRIAECCANSQANAINYDAAGNKIGNCSATIPAEDIDMSTARGLPSTHFWNRRASEKQFWENHGANKDFYLDQARGLPAVQSMLAEGKSPAQIRAEHPNLGNTLDAYYNPNNMIQVNRDANGNMSFLDDGKHRVLAAKELGLKVPVQIANDQAPSNVQSAAPVGKSAAQIRGERFQDSLLSFPSQTASNAASNSADSDSRPGVPERERDIVAERQSDGWERGAALQKPTASANRELHGRTSETGENLRGNYTVVDPNTGTVTSNGNLEITKGNHKGMPSRTSAYLPGDERGHIQASSLGGSNDPSNIVPQHHDVNRYGWRGMERGETDALKNGASIDSTKIAYVDGKSGDRPSAFMVNDKITYPDGHTENVHLSFSNESYADQAEEERIVASLGDEIYDAPNPDAARESMSPEEYKALMEEADQVDFDIRDEYAPADYSGLPPSAREDNNEDKKSDQTEDDRKREESEDTEEADEDEEPEDAEENGENEEPEDAEETGEGEKPEDAEENGEDEESEDTEENGEDEESEDTEENGEDEESEDTEENGEDEESEDTEENGEDENPEDTEENGEDENPKDTEENGEDENPKDAEETGEDENPEDAEENCENEEPEDAEETGEDEVPEDTEENGEDEESEDTEENGEDEESEDTEENGEDEESEDTEENGEDENPEDTEENGEDENPKDTEENGEDENPKDAEETGEDENPEDAEENGEDENPEDAEEATEGKASDKDQIDDEEQDPDDDETDDKNREDENGIEDADDPQDEENESNGIEDGSSDDDAAAMSAEENGISDTPEDSPSQASDNGISDDDSGQTPASKEDNGISDGDSVPDASNDQDNGISGEDPASSGSAEAPAESSSQDNGISQ